MWTPGERRGQLRMVVFPKKSINWRGGWAPTERRICLQVLAHTCISRVTLVQEADSSDPACSSVNEDSAISLGVGWGGCVENSRRHINGVSHLPGKLEIVTVTTPCVWNNNWMYQRFQQVHRQADDMQGGHLFKLLSDFIKIIRISLQHYFQDVSIPLKADHLPTTPPDRLDQAWKPENGIWSSCVSWLCSQALSPRTIILTSWSFMSQWSGFSPSAALLNKVRCSQGHPF